MATKQWDNPPAMQIDSDTNYLATIETDRGTIELELYSRVAPQTVNNFIFLAQEGFYDGVTFHRVISNFMIQGGDPTGTGRGGPGYQFEDEVKGIRDTQVMHGEDIAAMRPVVDGMRGLVWKLAASVLLGAGGVAAMFMGVAKVATG